MDPKPVRPRVNAEPQPASHRMYVGNPGGPLPYDPSRLVPSLSVDELSRVREANARDKVPAPTDFKPLQDTRTMSLEDLMLGVKEGPTEDFAGKIDGGGVKDSMVDPENKPMMALVPRALIIGCAKVLTYGAVKYAPNNWRRGMRWGECADALLRHFFAWLEGEDTDPESGLSHLAHCSANLAFLMHMEGNDAYKSLDDRPNVQ